MAGSAILTLDTRWWSSPGPPSFLQGSFGSRPGEGRGRAQGRVRCGGDHRVPTHWSSQQCPEVGIAILIGWLGKLRPRKGKGLVHHHTAQRGQGPDWNSHFLTHFDSFHRCPGVTCLYFQHPRWSNSDGDPHPAISQDEVDLSPAAPPLSTPICGVPRQEAQQWHSTAKFRLIRVPALKLGRVGGLVGHLGSHQGCHGQGVSGWPQDLDQPLHPHSIPGCAPPVPP